MLLLLARLAAGVQIITLSGALRFAPVAPACAYRYSLFFQPEGFDGQASFTDDCRRVVVALGLVLALAKPSQPHLQVRCYFQDVQGLRAGAKVRLAGVEVGSVTSVRVRPERRDQPAEVTMFLQTPYELKIPNDSVVMLETAGVLGEVFPEIDSRGAKPSAAADAKGK
jgi:hypothetical protein